MLGLPGKKKLLNLSWRFGGSVANKIRFLFPVAACLPFLEDGDKLRVLHGQSHAGVGDVITFYKDDIFVAHRIMQKKTQQNRPVIITKGDNAPQFDPPLRLQEIVGRVIAVERDGRLMKMDTLSWKVLGWLIVVKTHVRGKLSAVRQSANIRKCMGWRVSRF